MDDLFTSRAKHDAAVQRVQRSIKEGIKLKKQISVRGRSSLWQNITRSASYKQSCHIVDISDLRRVVDVHIDTRMKYDSVHTIEVEPLVTMETLMQVCKFYGCVPQVLPEFKGITVGGAINGAALESGSFKAGQFNDIAVAMDVVLGDGSLKRCSRDENSDLFYGISGAFGTLGIIVSVTLTLCTYFPYVHLRYIPCTSWENAQARLDDLLSLPEQNKIDYVDFVSYSKTSCVLMVGSRERDHGRKMYQPAWYSKLFYKHVQDVINSTHQASDTSDKLPPSLAKQKMFQEWMTLEDYLFRFDRGGFWMLSLGLDQSPLTRLLFGWGFGTQYLYPVLHMNETMAEWTFVIQDFYVPYQKVGQMLNYVHSEMGISPVWMCPVRCTSQSQLFSPHYLTTKEVNCGGKEFCVNLGIYGMPRNLQGKRILPHVALRGAEKQLQDNHGRKMLYTHSYYSLEEFWKIYDKVTYLKLREKYNAQGCFPDISQKVLSKYPNWKYLAPNLPMVGIGLYSILSIILVVMYISLSKLWEVVEPLL